MSESFVKIPSKLIFNPKISATELRVLSTLIFWGGLNSQEPGHIKYGAEKLGKQVGIGRIACRKALLSLEQLNLIKIKHRGNLANESYGLSNDIELTISAGLEFLESGGSPETGDQYLNDTGNQYLNDTGNQYLNDTGRLYQKDTGVYLKDTGVYLKDTGHIDDRFKINLNLNKIYARENAPTRMCAHTRNEPADVATGLSIPNGDAIASADNSAKDVGTAAAQTELEDYCLVSAFFEAFPELQAWAYLARIGGYITIQPIGKIGERKLDKIKRGVAGWFQLRGVKLAFVPVNEKNKGVILNREVA